MKKRQGFVSNSSSSSFIVLGSIVDKKRVKEIRSKMTDQEIDKSYNEIINTDDGDTYICGVYLPSPDDGSFESIDIESLETKKAEAVQILNKYGLSESKVQLHFGTRYC